MVTITEQAALELKKLLASRGAGADFGLRLAISRGGCAGWQYEMEITQPREGDQITHLDGGCLMVAADSAERLDGCRVAYADSLSDAGFRIENPNAARSCGCGTSFEEAGKPLEPDEIEDCGKS